MDPRARRILLVQGWRTYDGSNYGNRTGPYYKELIDHLSQKGGVVTFDYHDNAAVVRVLSRLRSTLADGAFSDIVAHSMGGALIVQLMREGHDFRGSTIVLCQAHISPPRIISMVCAYARRLPFYRLIKVPVSLMIPARVCTSNWSILTDVANTARCMYIHQYADVTAMMAGDAVDVLYRHDGPVSVVCSTDDALPNQMGPETLLSLARWADRPTRRLFLIKARHMPTWDTEPTRAMMCHVLDLALSARSGARLVDGDTT